MPDPTYAQGPNGLWCSVCGSDVSDCYTHTKWHNELDNLAEATRSLTKAVESLNTTLRNITGQLTGDGMTLADLIGHYSHPWGDERSRPMNDLKEWVEYIKRGGT